MNCLILIPRYVHSDGEGYSFPLGICYISAMMKKHVDGDIYTMNLNHTDENIEELLHRVIIEKDIRMVLTGGLCLDYHIIHNLLKLIKELQSEIVTIVGGGIITGDPLPAMEALKFADYGVIGEGEDTVVELYHALEHQMDVSNVKGIVYSKAGKFILNENRKDITELENIPWPDYEGFGFEHYLNNITAASVMATKRNTLFMLTSRSCPYRCTFCFHTSGQFYRQRNVEDVFRELDYLCSKYIFEYIFFVDELFGTSLERLKIFCERIKKYNIKGWYSYFRVDQVTEEKVRLLKQSGCKCMFFGLESADNSVLKSMNKNITVQQIERALQIVYKEGVAFNGCFIFGDSEETYESALNTLQWWEENLQYKIMLLPISCYPGTEIYNRAVREGKIKDRVKFLKDGCPLINVSKMTDEEYFDIMKRLSDAKIKIIGDLEFVTIKNIDYEKHVFSLESKCDSCSKNVIWENNNMFMEPDLICENCGKKFAVPVIKELLINAKQNLTILLERYDKIAFWGIGKTVDKFLIALEVETLDNVYLIDRNKGSLGAKFIYTPEILEREEFDVVIVAVPRYFGNIYEDAKSFVAEEHILTISALCEPNFSIK